MSTKHECEKEITLKELSDGQNALRKDLNKNGTRTIILLGVIGIFVFLVGFTATKASDAEKSSQQAIMIATEVKGQHAVSEERFKWIEKTLLRVEKVLAEKE